MAARDGGPVAVLAMFPIVAFLGAVVGVPALAALWALFRLADRLALWRWPAPAYLGVEASSSRSE